VARDPDEALIRRCRAGESAAFTVLIGRYERPIYNAAYRVLGNADDAADITQVVFLRIAERLDEYDARFKFFSWIYRIALNEALNLLRKQGREEPLDEDAQFPDGRHADPEWRAEEAERSVRIQGALMKLKPEDRMLLVLRHYSECSYREIGEALGLDEKTVKSRLFEVRQRMRGLLREVQPA
jgi:RNA polymerase sigma-70 factor (ECF subfamily)